MRIFTPFAFAIVLAITLQSHSAADIVVDSGSISGSSSNTGSYVAETSTFSLAAGEIARTELFTQLTVIDDGVEIIVNGTSLFLSADTSQYGAQDFVPTASQPNDIADPWTGNANGVPRLTIQSNVSGTMFSGSVDTAASSAIAYQPNFTVTDFSSLLVVGANNIEFVNHNGFEGAALTGRYSVTVFSVPEPGTFALLSAFALVASLRRRRSHSFR